MREQFPFGKTKWHTQWDIVLLSFLLPSMVVKIVLFSSFEVPWQKEVLQVKILLPGALECFIKPHQHHLG
jgi:hypothetical protein